MPKIRLVKGNTYQCSSCKELFAKKYYHPDKTHKYGIHSRCKKCCQEEGKTYWAKHESKMRHSFRSTERRKLVKGKIFSILGHKCARCGFGDMRALQIDHVDGSGRKAKRGISIDRFYREILENLHTGKFQILCANCNWIKREENNEWAPYWTKYRKL